MKHKLFVFFVFLLMVACSPRPSEEVSSVTNVAPHLSETPSSQTPAPKETPTQVSTLAIEEKQTEAARIINATLTAQAEMITTIFALTPSPTPSPTRTPRPTNTSTPVPPTVPIATLNARATKEMLEAACDEYNTDSDRATVISPDGEWAAIRCGSDSEQVMIVQNQKGVKWLFNFVDFLNPDLDGMWGSLVPLAWSSDGRFLYFTKYLGWDGGGNQCFSGIGVFGLYRLHLQTGTLVILVPTDDFADHHILFSPTLDYYAVDQNGVRITNLETNEIIQIYATGVMGMLWSPDGRYLAYAVASCGEEFVESSSIFVWDSITGLTQTLFTTTEMVLRPLSWDNSIVVFEGEEWGENNATYTIFEYDLSQSGIIFSGTVTPRP